MGQRLEHARLALGEIDVLPRRRAAHVEPLDGDRLPLALVDAVERPSLGALAEGPEQDVAPVAQGLAHLRSQTEDEVEDEGEDDGVVREAHDGVEEDRAPDLTAGDAHVGHLEAHADGEGEVREVEVARR